MKHNAFKPALSALLCAGWALLAETSGRRLGSQGAFRKHERLNILKPGEEDAGRNESGSEQIAADSRSGDHEGLTFV